MTRSSTSAGVDDPNLESVLPKTQKHFDSIPVELRERAQWVTWKSEERNGKATKVPYNARTGRLAKSTDPATWSTFEEAVRAYEQGGLDGIGFVFTDEDPFCGIDLDKCRNPETGELEEWASRIVQQLDTHTEISVSGKGVHLILKGKLRGKRNRTGRIEMYDHDRYFCMTGQHMDQSPKSVNKRQQQLKNLYFETFTPAVSRQAPSVQPENHSGTPYLTLDRLIQRINDLEKGKRLFQGDTSGYPSQSEADAAFFSIARRQGGNDDTIVEAWRQSNLYRADKDRETYLRPTLDLSKQNGGNPIEPESLPAAPISFSALQKKHAQLREPIIDGLLRRGEVCNIIAPSKVGKSWLAHGLAFSIGDGTKWLNRFRCRKGRVLLIDNELHTETLSFRLTKVCDEIGLYQQKHIDVLSLRGRLTDYLGLKPIIHHHCSEGNYDAIIVDAHYRMLPDGVNENDNAAMARLFNLIDEFADRTGAAWLLIHHASKGNQSEKAITDVGAGAGAQSRAADTHLILRPHEEPDHVVLDAVVRSFPPVEPFVLRWEYPLWVPAPNMDAARVKGRHTKLEEAQDRRDQETDRTLLRLLEPWRSCSELRKLTGMNENRIQRSINRLMDEEEQLETKTENRRGNTCPVYRCKKF